MSKLTTALAAAALAGATATGTALAGEDEDTLPGDPGSTLVVFHADGTQSSSPSVGAGAFFRQLVAEGAAGGSSVQHTEHGGAEDYVAVGTSHPSGTRYKRLAREPGRRAALAKISGRSRRLADGRRLTERGYAVDIASGRVHRVPVDTAKVLALDPRAGAANTEYVYNAMIAPVPPVADPDGAPYSPESGR